MKKYNKKCKYCNFLSIYRCEMCYYIENQFIYEGKFIMQGQKMNNKKSKIIIGIIIGILVLAGGGIGIYFITTNKDTPETTTETLAENDVATDLDSEEKTTTENTTDEKATTEKKTTEELTTEEMTTEATTETTTERETTTETTTEHSHSYNVVATKNATCTENGYKEYKCSCGDTYKKTINALGHNSSRPTCTTDGVCSRCGCVTEKAHGHKWTTKTTTETIPHEEEGHEELWVRFNDGYEMPYVNDGPTMQELMAHGGSYCKIEKWIVDKPAWTETITHETTTCDHCGATK